MPCTVAPPAAHGTRCISLGGSFPLCNVKLHDLQQNAFAREFGHMLGHHVPGLSTLNRLRRSFSGPAARWFRCAVPPITVNWFDRRLSSVCRTLHSQPAPLWPCSSVFVVAFPALRFVTERTICVRNTSLTQHGFAGERDLRTKRSAPDTSVKDGPAHKATAHSAPAPQLPLCRHGLLDLRVCKNGVHAGKSFYCCRLQRDHPDRCNNCFVWLTDTPERRGVDDSVRRKDVSGSLSQNHSSGSAAGGLSSMLCPGQAPAVSGLAQGSAKELVQTRHAVSAQPYVGMRDRLMWAKSHCKCAAAGGACDV